MRTTLVPLTLPLLLATALAATPGTARANGGNSHLWITLQAREHLPEGALRDLLMDPDYRHALLNGSVFPDGGYVVSDDYGETAHWEPFLSGYVRWIRRTFDPPFHRGEAALHVAFLFGVASHDLADMVFDSLFMKVAEVEDASGWSDGLLDSFDTASDVLLVAETGQDEPLEPFAPVDDLVTVFTEEVGYPAAAAAITDGQAYLPLVLQHTRSKGLNDPEQVAEFRAQYPWGAAHLLDPLAPGSPPTEAVVVAAYWQALWDRLHGVTNPENQVIATHPSPGAVGHPTDHTLVSSQLAVVFGYEFEQGSVAITVTDAEGGDHPVSLRPWGNLVRLLPEADWPAGATLTVTVAGGAATLDGLVFPDPWSFSFSTAPGVATPCCADPTPNTSDPAPPTPPTHDGGCATGGSPGTPWPWPWLLLLGALGFVRHRARRTRRTRRTRRARRARRARHS